MLKLISIGLKVKTPIVVRVDNVGAMFMAELDKEPALWIFGTISGEIC